MFLQLRLSYVELSCWNSKWEYWGYVLFEILIFPQADDSFDISFGFDSRSWYAVSFVYCDFSSFFFEERDLLIISIPRQYNLYPYYNTIYFIFKFLYNLFFCFCENVNKRSNFFSHTFWCRTIQNNFKRRENIKSDFLVGTKFFGNTVIITLEFYLSIYTYGWILFIFYPLHLVVYLVKKNIINI